MDEIPRLTFNRLVRTIVFTPHAIASRGHDFQVDQQQTVLHMTKHYPQPGTFFLAAAVLALTILHQTVSGQPGPPSRNDAIRIKVTEALALQLEGKKFSKTISGEILTGIESIDEKNKKFKVKHFSRLFPPAGKHEARHRKYGLHLWYEVRMEKGNSVADAVKSYKADKAIVKAEPVHLKSINGSANKNTRGIVADKVAHREKVILPAGSNDPMLADQWHYQNTGQTGGLAGADIKLVDAWKLETGKKEVIVALTDGGIEANHEDLKGNMWVNKGEIPGNAVDDDNNGYIDDINGYSFVDNTGDITAHYHGTHVAGTIAAMSNNGIGVAGIAGGSGSGDGVRLMSCAVYSNTSSGGHPESFVYAADNGAVISQNSWGYIHPGVYEEAVLEAIDYFIAEAGKDEAGNQVGPMKGGLVIFAAGNNDSENQYYPGYYAPTFAVASTNHRDAKAFYSNFGSWVDIAAPGGETEVQNEQGVLSTLPANQYGYLQGTSMAAPHVSGVAALLISSYAAPGFTPEMLKQRMQQTSNKIDHISGHPGKMGAGRINAFTALQKDDDVAPHTVTDLAVTKVDVGEITLTWTAPLDENGFVSAYDLRYDTAPITEENFQYADAATGLPFPATAGSRETFAIKGLAGETHFYFAVKAKDFQGNFSQISNVVSQLSAPAPIMEFAPASLSVSLRTAQSAEREFAIVNTGKAALTFSLTDADEKDFANYSPVAGTLAPGARQPVTVIFSANEKLAGIYEQQITITSNDPLRNTTTYPLTLQVSNNDAPITSVDPDNLDFKAVQTGTSRTRSFSVYNGGSDPLIIDNIEVEDPQFTTDVPPGYVIGPFKRSAITVTFTPASTGVFTARLSLHTNDTANPVSHVELSGEGLNEPPIVTIPDSIVIAVDKGTTGRQTLRLQNNGSESRGFRLNILNKGLAEGSGNPQQDLSNKMDSSALRAREALRSALAERSVDPALSSVKTEQRFPATDLAGYDSTTRKYSTGFEDFSPGTIHEQENWKSNRGWIVETNNPNSGQKHLQGQSDGSGGQTLAFSPPSMIEYDENGWAKSILTSAEMRLNLDRSGGTSWEISFQESPVHWSGGYVVTRIHINSNQDVTVLTVDENYEVHWLPISVPVSTGYFTLAVESNAVADETGFPRFDVYINNKLVFSGNSLGQSIGEVVFISEAETSGATVDVDDFVLTDGEHITQYLTATPLSGTIPANGSTGFFLDYDATDMRFGIYNADIEVLLDEEDQLKVSSELTVTGKASAAAHVLLSTNRMAMYPGETYDLSYRIRNTGGTVINYQVKLPSGFSSTSSLSGTIPIRGDITLPLKFDSKNYPPGIYRDSLEVHVAGAETPVVYSPLRIVIWEKQSEYYAEFPDIIQLKMTHGEVVTTTIQVQNHGENPYSYEMFNSYIDAPQGAVTAFPAFGTVKKGEVENVTITIDSRLLKVGWDDYVYDIWTNDPVHPYNNHVYLRVNVFPDSSLVGKIEREVWNGVKGNQVSAIPVNSEPSAKSELALLEAPAQTGDNYGARIRGYVLVPQSGHYTFWIASNDNSELWLSPDDDPEKKQKIAYVNGATNPRQWDKFPSQIAEFISLRGGSRYYIEVLHKEGVGSDHVAVGWSADWPYNGPEGPIPGINLMKFTGPQQPDNHPPVVAITSPVADATFNAPATITVDANVTDQDDNVVKVEFYNDKIKIAEDAIAPYSFDWRDVATGDYELIAIAVDGYGATDTASVHVSVTPGQPCASAGSIVREQWDGISGTMISSITLDKEPSGKQSLTLFESPSNIGDNYGARIRGFLCVPEDGQYIFWIASNDKSELYLSTDETEANKVRIAQVSGYTNSRQWTKYPAQQQSQPRHLLAGQRYYIEALHKEGTGSDHLAVGWQLPDGILERPIPGDRLVPFDIAAEVICGKGTITREYWTAVSGSKVSDIPVTSAPDGSEALQLLEGPVNAGSNYAARISGYICPPASGDYHFWISSNDHSELWLSPDGDPSRKQKIAFVSGATAVREWNKFASQRSGGIQLTEGTSYYIEVLHKQGVGSDHVAVGWQLPDGTLERPIPGNRLSPSAKSGASAARVGSGNQPEENDSLLKDAVLRLYPNPVDGQRLTLDIESFSAGSSVNHIEIRQLTGRRVYSEEIICKEDCSTEINTENFPPGLYILQVKTRGRTLTERLVIR